MPGSSVHLSSDKHDRDIRRRERGKPLIPQARWRFWQGTYVVACIAGLVAVLVFTSGTWLAIGLTIMAFFLAGLYEVLVDFSYTNYRQEWELANGPDIEADQGAEPGTDD